MLRKRMSIAMLSLSVIFIGAACTPEQAQIVAQEAYGISLSNAEASAVSAHLNAVPPEPLSVPEKILARWQGTGDGPRAVRIAKCESGFNRFSQNQHSTAYGIFQFLNATWKSTGIAKTSDEDLQIEAAFRLYKQRGFQPWVCRG